MRRFLIRCLLRCYPRPWRARYGEEFAALLEDLPPTPGRLLDVAGHAADAHGRRWVQQLKEMRMGGVLNGQERRFWWHWVRVLLLAGALIGAVSRLVPLGLALGGFFVADHRALGRQLAVLPLGLTAGQWWGLLGEAQSLVTIPFLAVVGLGLGLGQWRVLRALFPTLSRWWVAITVAGPLAALMVMTTDRSYSRFTDLISMTDYFLGYLAHVTTRNGVPGAAHAPLAYLLPTTTFAGIAAVGQAYLLKDAVRRAGWWVGVAILAASAGLVAARLFAPLRAAGVQLSPAIVQPGALAVDSAVLIAQVGTACAVYGIVSGLGLIALHRGQRAPRKSLATAGD
jgi:hypothetical protein